MIDDVVKVIVSVLIANDKTGEHAPKMKSRGMSR
jgi:hypothetical protein